MSDADRDARATIGTRLDLTLVVEAAAGTGKTTELVGRIVAVLGAGATDVERLVAVTFTEKAAGELKLRLRTGLEGARRQAPSDAVRRHCERALAHLEDARVSTIHGFCADLLRERPVEAGVDPLFEVMTEPQARRLYHEAFAGWFQEVLASPPEGVRRALRRQLASDRDGSATERLERAGWSLAGWPDHRAVWRRDDFDRTAAITHLVQRVQAFADLTRRCTNASDRFYRDTWPARRAADELRVVEAGGRADADGREAILTALVQDRRFRRDVKEGYRSNWRNGPAPADAMQAYQALVADLAAFQRAADADLAAVLQPALLETLDRYDALKARLGRLDFLDLLLRTRELLRRSPHVRAELQQRFTHIFVDEFQDTDPLQAEILLLLAGDDPAVDDWRRVVPPAGKLFIVGDPKQSIYRFRRADVGIYQEVKRLLVARGAVPLELTRSFRAAPAIQRLVNAAFAPEMAGNSGDTQPGYVPLAPHRPDPPDRPSVIVLPVPRPYGRRALSQDAVEQSLPDAVGAFLGWLLGESGWTVTERERPGEAVPVAARHVCVLFRRFDSFFKGDVTRAYVDALEARQIPHLLVGGRGFHDREEVGTLRAALSAIEWPDDELAVFATLRGSLFGIGDEELLLYRERVGRFHPFRRPPDPLPESLAPIGQALDLLRRLHLRRNRRPVADTIATLLAETRAHAAFALRPSGEQALANVLHVPELARAYEAAGGLSFRGFVDQLRDDAEDGHTSDAPILEEGSDGVRIMTVHRAKGLEFPVVVLADITSKIARTDPERFVDAPRGLCALKIGGWAPPELIDHEDEERIRDEAEGVRIAYVAATRARDLLVIPAVGDGAYPPKSWIAPLNRAIYPPPELRGRPASAAGCPAFGTDSVLSRPADELAMGAVRPGAHRFSGAGTGSYEVVWWDPLVLPLGVARAFGLRRHDLITKEVAPEIIEADLRAYEAWRASRDATLAAGSRPSLTVRTATAAAAGGELPPDLDTIAEPGLVVVGAEDGSRPAGRRFGALVHAVLATIPLAGSREDLGAIAAQQGRVLGASPAEIEAAAALVRTALSHPLLERARRADERRECRRETPVTIRTGAGDLIEGVIDLAFREAGRWTVVDFKTDRELEGREAEYRRQVRLYALAVASATGEPAAGVLVRL